MRFSLSFPSTRCGSPLACGSALEEISAQSLPDEGAAYARPSDSGRTVEKLAGKSAGGPETANPATATPSRARLAVHWLIVRGNQYGILARDGVPLACL